MHIILKTIKERCDINMVRVTKMKYFNIYSNNYGYIVHNTKKRFEEGHTHIKNFNTAKYVAYLSLYKKLPKKNHLSTYLIESVIRVSSDRKYIAKLNSLKDSINNKKIRNE